MYKLILGPGVQYEIGLMQGNVLHLYKYPEFGINTPKDWEHLFKTYTDEGLVRLHKTKGRIINDENGQEFTFQQIMDMMNAGHKMIGRP